MAEIFVIGRNSPPKIFNAAGENQPPAWHDAGKDEGKVIKKHDYNAAPQA